MAADDTILAVVWKERVLGHGCNFAEVYIADPSQFRRKFSMDTYGSPVQKYGSELAKESNAVVAMNGDFYKFRAEGMTVYNRTLYRFNPVKLELCHVNSDGELLFTYAGELASKEQAEQYVKDNDVLFTLAFGPVLIADGEPHISSNSYLIGEVNTRYSRSILSTRGNGHYLLTTCNNGYGTPTCTIAEARDMMMSKKVENAYVLDGGQTAEIIIRPETAEGEAIMVFGPFDSSNLSGHKLVVYEVLYDTETGERLVGHEEITSYSQSVTIPGGHTSASDGLTGSHLGRASEYGRGLLSARGGEPERPGGNQKEVRRARTYRPGCD